MRPIKNLLSDGYFKLFLKYTFWILLICLILASISFRNILFVEQNPFFYEQF